MLGGAAQQDLGSWDGRTTSCTQEHHRSGQERGRKSLGPASPLLPPSSASASIGRPGRKLEGKGIWER